MASASKQELNFYRPCWRKGPLDKAAAEGRAKWSKSRDRFFNVTLPQVQSDIAKLKKELASMKASGQWPREAVNAHRRHIRKLEKLVKEQAEIKKWPPAFTTTRSGTAIYDVAVHELGHVFHGRMPSGMAYGYEVLGGTRPDNFTSVWKGKISKKGRNVAHAISEYAGSNTKEHFAEAFCAMNAGGEYAKAVSPAVQGLVKDVLRSVP